MTITLTKLVDGMQHALEDQGYELYSKTPKERFTVLIMFHPEHKGFAFIVFDKDDLGVCERIDAYVDIAKDKAEAFRSIRSQREDGSIRPEG
jgi:hypothetical protein